MTNLILKCFFFGKKFNSYQIFFWGNCSPRFSNRPLCGRVQFTGAADGICRSLYRTRTAEISNRPKRRFTRSVRLDYGRKRKTSCTFFRLVKKNTASINCSRVARLSSGRTPDSFSIATASVSVTFTGHRVVVAIVGVFVSARPKERLT